MRVRKIGLARSRETRDRADDARSSTARAQPLPLLCRLCIIVDAMRVGEDASQDGLAVCVRRACNSYGNLEVLRNLDMNVPSGNVYVLQPRL